MTTLDEYEKSVALAIHLLLVGHTKMGKSDYVAQAAIDGYEVVYVDNDNGLATLLNRLEGNESAKKRIHYFNPENMADFVEKFLTKGIFRYNIRTRSEFSSMDAKQDDRITEIIPSRVPAQLILSIDSWTSFAYSIMQGTATAKKVSLLDIDKLSRELYGPSFYYATQLLTILQKAPFHLIVQAHEGIYERKEKPPGVNNVDEKDMIIKETLKVPMSTSMPHGATLGKFFNEVGWMVINARNERRLDFTTVNGRVGGGTANAIGDPRKEFSFLNLFGKGKKPEYNGLPWIRELSKAEFDVEMGRTPVESKEVKIPVAASAADVVIKTPATGTSLGALFGKKN